MANPLVLVIGAGPGVGGSVARRFGREGFDAALVSRGEARLAELADSLRGSGVAAEWTAADVTDAEAARDAVERLVRGRTVGVLHFNPSVYRARSPLELTAAELAEDLALGVGALLTTVQAARPGLRAGSRVTATGSAAADRPSPDVASLGVQKAGLRNLVQSLDGTLAPHGIRAVSVTVDGLLAPTDPGSPFHPDRVAEAVYAAACRPAEQWRAHVVHPG
jgi:NAD(P)-dependent dehydrogenase (short-subunit alcohol dehydrogenase family)